MPKRSTPTFAAAALAAALVLPGCQTGAPPHLGVIDATYNGSYGEARQRLKRELASTAKPAAASDSSHAAGDGGKINRDFLLGRLRLLLMTLADGYAPADLRLVDRVYDLLRTQGLNRDKGLASVVVNEDVKTWKGEPFEQALALHYVSVYQAMQGSWDNARAAATGALFQLRDFNKDKGTPRRSAAATAPDAPGEARGSDSPGYVAERSDFVLGYLMAGIANTQMAAEAGDDRRDDEAGDYFREALRLRPDLGGLVEDLRGGRYNTLLVVDYGRGPQKVGVGDDAAIAAFVPQTPSDRLPLRIALRGEDTDTGGRGEHAGPTRAAYPWVCDANAMAADHRWNHLENVRRAKSMIGTGLLAGGALSSVYGLGQRDEGAMYAGLGMLLAGAVAKGGAHADTRHLEALPQRVYLVPLRVERPGTRVELQVEGDYGSRLVLAGLAPPPLVSGAPVAQLRYVRLLADQTAPPVWATSGRILYGNDRTGPLAALSGGGSGGGRDALPYILGGHDLRVPTDAVLDDYQRAGFLRDFSLSDLRELYRLEGLKLEVQEEGGLPGLHVLEGGRSLAPPLAGTLGFARLFGQEHPAYTPRSPRVRALAAEFTREGRGETRITLGSE